MYYIIVNPASKTGRGQIIWEELQKELDRKKVEYTVFLTKKSGDATDYARQLSSQSKQEELNVIVLGGDGTMNEVVNGLENVEQVKLGYIPTGSSNDLARATGIQTQPIQALEAIFRGDRVLQMDIGQVTYDIAPQDSPTGERMSRSRRFCVSSGVGFDAAVCEEALHSKMKKLLNKLRLGKLTYLGIAVRQLMSGPTVPCRITLDHQKEIILKKFLFVASMIHQYEGGGFKFCPDANYEDGLLDICVVGELPKARMFRILPTAFKGNHLKFEHIDAYRAKTVDIQIDEPIWLHTDGEVPCRTDKVQLTCLEKKMNLYY